MLDQVLHWISLYGYPALCALLVLGIVGLPVPDETLLTFVGYLVYSGRMKLHYAFIAAFMGSSCGITLSYVLGRSFGAPLLHKYGKYVHITEEMIARTHYWFEHAGHWVLFFGYFIPGVRHFSAYAAGMSETEFRTFAIYAYGGAFFWCATFISAGYFLGDRWQKVSDEVHHYILFGFGFFIVLGLVFFVVQHFRMRRKKP